MTFIMTISICFLLGCSSGNKKEPMLKSQHPISNDSIINENDSILKTGWYYVSDTNTGYKRKLDKSDKYYFIDPIPFLTVNNFTEIKIIEIQESKNHNTLLGFTPDKDGQKKWNVATGKALGKVVAFILDNQLLDARLIYSQSQGNSEWIQTLWDDDKYSRKELEHFKTIIETEINRVKKTK